MASNGIFLFPDDSKLVEFLDINFFEDPSIMQFVHRNFIVYNSFYYFYLLFLIIKNRNKFFYKPILIIGFILFIQIFLGVLKILSGVKIIYASLHQVNSVLIILSTIYLLYISKFRKII